MALPVGSGLEAEGYDTSPHVAVVGCEAMSRVWDGV